MSSNRRAQRINTLIREEVSKILNREVDFPEGSLVTVTRVDVSPDGRYAAIFISLYSAEQKIVLEILQKNVYALQQMLNRRLRMRPVPKIRFAIDQEEERRERVEKSLGEVRRKGEL